MTEKLTIEKIKEMIADNPYSYFAVQYVQFLLNRVEELEQHYDQLSKHICEDGVILEKLRDRSEAFDGHISFLGNDLKELELKCAELEKELNIKKQLWIPVQNYGNHIVTRRQYEELELKYQAARNIAIESYSDCIDKEQCRIQCDEEIEEELQRLKNQK